MRVSGFTIVRNAVKLQYPVRQSIASILPICDEFIVNVGDSDDGTLELIQSIGSPKIRIVQTVWNMTQGSGVLSEQTNTALGHCTGDWAFYLQTDEVIHEADLPKLKQCMERYLNDPSVDALRFRWFHFYGSHFRYRIDKGWYQKQDRIIRNNSTVESFGDAFSFRRKDGGDLRTKNTGCFVYHYGWVFTEEVMARRRLNHGALWGVSPQEQKKRAKHAFGDLKRFPVYFGSHPAVMKSLIEAHPISQQDQANIQKRFWWNPLLWFKVRYKTGRRVKTKIDEAI